MLVEAESFPNSYVASTCEFPRNTTIRLSIHNLELSFKSFCSMFPKSTHETFAQKMYQTYKGNKRFSKPKLARTDFTINHYAGDVSKLLCFFFNSLSLQKLKFLVTYICFQ